MALLHRIELMSSAARPGTPAPGTSHLGQTTVWCPAGAEDPPHRHMARRMKRDRRNVVEEGRHSTMGRRGKTSMFVVTGPLLMNSRIRKNNFRTSSFVSPNPTINPDLTKSSGLT
jgi:hypothetical protein